jgi:hypothetical protein
MRVPVPHHLDAAVFVALADDVSEPSGLPIGTV